MNVINDAISKIHFIQNSKSCTVFNDIKIDKYFPTDILRSKLIIYYDENFNSNQRLTTNQALQYANHFITTGYAILLNLDNFFFKKPCSHFKWKFFYNIVWYWCLEN
ncbi:unnamed protein product [Rotaria sp. Silwood2]|nr:unnamed protein product [Rotaria sp. Silwood2]